MKDGQMRERERERDTEHHKTGEKAQTFNPETFGLPVQMFTKKDMAGGQYNHLWEILVSLIFSFVTLIRVLAYYLLT